MNIKINLTSSEDRTVHNIVFNSDLPLSNEQLLEVLVNWVNKVTLGGSGVEEQRDSDKP